MLKEAEDELDAELKELLERNKKNLSELHTDMREVSRTVSDEKTPMIVQIKKVGRAPSGTRKPAFGDSALREKETNKR